MAKISFIFDQIFVAPLLLKLIIMFAASDDYLWKGVLYAFLLLATSTLQTIFLSRSGFTQEVVQVSTRLFFLT
jgi:hypothetical protein